MKSIKNKAPTVSVEVQASRRVSLNLTEDAIQSRQVKTLNAQLRESEEQYRTLFDLGPVAVYSCSTSGVIEKFNDRAAELWGRKPALGDTDERFCGSFKLFRPDGSFMPHDQCPMAEVLSGAISETRNAEVLIERPDGSRITVVVNIRPLKNQDGAVTGAINCFFDKTARPHHMASRTSPAVLALALSTCLHSVMSRVIFDAPITAEQKRRAKDRGEFLGGRSCGSEVTKKPGRRKSTR